MDIRAFILNDATKAAGKRQSQGKASADKSTSEYRIAQCLDMLNQYVGADTPVDCLQLLSPSWLDGFERFMTEGHLRLSPVTARERRKRLVRYGREAIKQRILPNLAITDPETTREIAQLPAINRKSDLEAVLSLFYFKKEYLESGRCASKNVAQLTAHTRLLGYAVLSVMLVGIGYEGLAQLRRRDFTGTHIYLPHLRASIAIPAEVAAIIRWLSLPDDQSDMLFFSHPTSQSAESLRLNVQAALRGCSLAYREGFDHPATQWLEMALALPVPLTADECHAIIDRMFAAPAAADASTALVQRAFEAVASSIRHLGYDWYCIRCISDMAPQLHILAPEPIAKSDNKKKKAVKKPDRTRGEIMMQVLSSAIKFSPMGSFAPKDIKVRERNGKKEVLPDRFLGSLLFVKANYTQIESVNRYLMSVRGGFIYSDLTEGRIRYCSIPAKEVEILQDVFDAKSSKRLTAKEGDAPRNLKGMRAKVLAGVYDGYEGKICKVVYDKDKRVRRVILRLQGDSLEVQYNADPDYLEIISPSPLTP